MKQIIRIAACLQILGVTAFPQPLSQKSPGTIIGVYYMAINMDCSKFKVPLCKYEEGIKYNPDGSFEWMISKNDRITSKEIGKFRFANDTVFHMEIAYYDYLNSECLEPADCSQAKELEQKGELVNDRFKKSKDDYISIVKLQGDGKYRMMIGGKKISVYSKLK